MAISPAVRPPLVFHTYTQKIIQSGADVFGVIADKTVTFPKITTREYTGNGAIVRTKVPSNKVTFATGGLIDVSGTATLQFDSGRRLSADVWCLTPRTRPIPSISKSS